jgi:hypothetical protein
MPATWTALDDDPDTGDSITVSILELEQRTLEVRNHHSGASAPADPAAGFTWHDTSAVPHRLWLYSQIDGGDPAWQPLGPLSRLPGPINADPATDDDREAPWQHYALRVENRATLPSAVAGNAGLLVYKTGNGEIYVADQPVANAWKALLSVTQSASRDTVELPMEGDVGNDAANPPTIATKGALEGWLFDATAEKRTFAFVMPKNWQGATDAQVRLWCVLDADETAGDDIEWSGEVRTVVPGAEKVGKAATALAASSTDIGAAADAIADGALHVCELTLDFDDATNPLAAGALVLVTVWRTTVGGAGKVSGTMVFRAELAYAQGPRHERA